MKRKIANKRRIRLVIVAVLLVVFIKFALLLGESKPKEELGLAVRLNLEGDFPNPKEGTALFNTELLMENIIRVHNKVPKYVIFKESETIPGLVLRYNVHDSVFEGGLPLLRSEEVTFLDGNKHEVGYTFKEGAEQKWYFDGREIASGMFDSSKIGISGFAVSEPEELEIVTMDIEGSAEFR